LLFLIWSCAGLCHEDALITTCTCLCERILRLLSHVWSDFYDSQRTPKSAQHAKLSMEAHLGLKLMLSQPQAFGHAQADEPPVTGSARTACTPSRLPHAWPAPDCGCVALPPRLVPVPSRRPPAAEARLPATRSSSVICSRRRRISRSSSWDCRPVSVVSPVELPPPPAESVHRAAMLLPAAGAGAAPPPTPLARSPSGRKAAKPPLCGESGRSSSNAPLGRVWAILVPKLCWPRARSSRLPRPAPTPEPPCVSTFAER